MSALFFLLDSYNFMEAQTHKELSHDGGRLLMWLTDSLSLQRGRHWIHGYCFRDQKKFLPTRKEDRKKYLAQSMDNLHLQMAEAKQKYGKLVVVGLGKLSCETLLGEVNLNDRAGTYWTNYRTMWRDIIDKQVWIANSTDAALFDPVLIVEITRVLTMAAWDAGIPTRIRLADEIPVFDWSSYL
jgi:hypothetical protein